MKYITNYLLYLLPFLLLSASINATHIMGGEVGWKCDTTGKYIFFASIYRDCSGVNLAPRGSFEIHNYPNIGNVTALTYTQSGSQEFSPYCRGGSAISCSNGSVESVFRYDIVTAPITLVGTPPAAGWIVTYDDLARNANDNLNSSTGFTFRAKMFDYPGRDTICRDNSPVFASIPTTLSCSGDPFGFNHNAIDSDFDSISYNWAKPLNRITGLFVEGVHPTVTTYKSNYSYTSPFPGPSQNMSNVAAVLDTATGELSFTSHNSGKYTAVIKASAYKCGIKAAEIYRELQSVISSNCAANNNAPRFFTPFSQSNGVQSFRDTAFVGSRLNYRIQVADLPAAGSLIFDSVYLFTNGVQYGLNYTDSTQGCPQPPCAVLASVPSRGYLGVMANFSWQTDSVHLANYDSCASLMNTYNFVFFATDDRCPIPKQRIANLSITLLDSSLITPPVITNTKDYYVFSKASLYPNPNEGNFQIQLPTTYSTINAVVRNIQGKLISEQSYTNTSLINIEISDPPGVYFITLLNDLGASMNMKLIKRK